MRCALLDDPTLFQNQPVCIQVVGRPFEDEELIRVTEEVDEIVNGGQIAPSAMTSRL
jgi:amidase